MKQPLRLTNRVRRFSRYELLEPPYGEPLHLPDEQIGLMRFRHSCDPIDRWRYVDQANKGKPCFGITWFRTARFFCNEYAVVGTETVRGLPRTFHITRDGKPEYRFRFLDASDVNKIGVAKVLHPCERKAWQKFDLWNQIFMVECPD